ncbi:MAG: membrane protein [Candidatus Hydrogenedentota bacterium]
MVARILVFAYGVFSYAVFLICFLYAIGFIGNVAVPKSIDGRPDSPLEYALIVNAGLLSVFALQHSVMARPSFKKWWTRIIPESAERSTYTLFSSLALFLLFAFWEPMGGVVWEIEEPTLRAILHTLFAAGWLIVLATTFLINHFDLFGLRQVTLFLMGKPYTPLAFKTPGPYRHVRHPLYVGWLMAFWATPTMTLAHLIFAVMTTAYILIAIQFEEKDLVTFHGQDYVEYRKATPMLIPKAKRTKLAGKEALADESAAI